jgi:hypothetical protein
MTDRRTGAVSGMPLFPYALALAASFDATQVIGVVSRSVARLYSRFGLELRDIKAGTGPRAPGVLACSIELTSATFAKLGCDADDLLGSITWFGDRSTCIARPRTGGEATGPYREFPRVAFGAPVADARSTITDNPRRDVTAPQMGDHDGGYPLPSPSPDGSPTHRPAHFARPLH